jgi:ribosomal protein L11 methyltransferase
MIPDRWLRLSVELPSEGDPGLLAEGLVHLGGRAVEERDGCLVTYLPPPDDPEGLVVEAARALEALSGLAPLNVTWSWQAHEEWEEVWKRGLGPRKVSDRIVVTPTWEPRRTPEAPDEVTIVLDPGMAFGTAEHPTTRGSLRLLDSTLTSGERIADVGCGSGILSIAAAKLGAREILAFEMDPYSCHATRENARANGVEELVRVRECRVAPGDLSPHGPLDGIVANIESEILRPLLPEFREALLPGGWLIVSGILTQERGGMEEAASRHLLELEADDVGGEWWSACFRKSASPGEGDGE